MGPSEEKAKLATIGANRLNDSPKAPSELERLSGTLDHQGELIAILAERLRSVTHNVPSETTQGSPERDRSVHISFQVDRVQNHNQAIQYLLDTLAV